MDTNKQYSHWMAMTASDAELYGELSSISANESAISDRFYSYLAFGTGGLRGFIGAGTNRMNIYIVRKATAALGQYLLSAGNTRPVAIAYDSRNKSELFASEAAGVLNSIGFEVYLFDEPTPTPVLSFTVCHLECSAGIVITASHNPAAYNGYKVYGSDGGQITQETAAAVAALMDSIDEFAVPSKRTSATKSVGESVKTAFLDRVYQNSIKVSEKSVGELKIVYTPLNGAGLKYVPDILKKAGEAEFITVKEQSRFDGDFPTCPFPNPEREDALELGLKLAGEQNADILLATDPDCDRVGVAVRHNNGYCRLTGNQVGILLLNTIIEEKNASKTMPKSPVAVKTIVTTPMAEKICREHGIELINVLTGFKYIGEAITTLEDIGRASDYIIGFEESCGYLAGTHARDKDAVEASLLVCQMAALAKSRGETLMDVLERLYAKYGFYASYLESHLFAGQQGLVDMQDAMGRLYATCPQTIGGHDVDEILDCRNGVSTGSDVIKTLPPADVCKITLKNNSSIVVRPSGTEPNLKIYFDICAENRQKCEEIYKELSSAMKGILSI